MLKAKRKQAEKVKASSLQKSVTSYDDFLRSYLPSFVEDEQGLYEDDNGESAETLGREAAGRTFWSSGDQ